MLKMSSKTMLDFDEAMGEAEQKQSAERERKTEHFCLVYCIT
jgi:hypothetical protein